MKWPTVPSDWSSQQNKIMVSTRRDYSVSTVHIQRVFYFCLYTQATTSCIKPVCLHTVAEQSTAKWCSFLLCFSFVNQYTYIKWCPFKMKTLMLHTILWTKKGWSKLLPEFVNRPCRQMPLLLSVFLWKKQNSVFKNKTRSSLVDVKPSDHTHCFCVLRALLAMIRELKMYIQFVCCAISSSCFSLHCVLGY